jgi:hypothetical protein
VIVATFVAPDPVAVQPVKPLVSATVGEAGTVEPLGSRTAIVSPAPSAPLALELKLAVTVLPAPAARVLKLSPTALGLVAAPTTTLEGGLAASVSVLVLMVKPVLAKLPAAGFVIPASRTDAAVLTGSAQVPPPFASVTVIVCAAVEAVAEQLLKPVGRVTVGAAGSAKPAGKTIVSFAPAPSAAPAVLLLVKPTVQLERAPPVCGEPAKLTALTLVAAAITTALDGEAVVVFEVDLRVKVVFA